MSPKRYLFVADDNRIAESVWISGEFEKLIPFAFLNTETRHQLLQEAESFARDGILTYLVTDAHFSFESQGEYGGDRLARDFLKGRSNDCRAVIYSIEPLRDPHYPPDDERVWAAKKNHTPDQIRAFLVNGVRPQIPECLDFLRRVATFRQALDLGIERPVEAMARIIEVLGGGFGEILPDPFSRKTSAYFDNAVSTYMKNRRMSPESEWKSEWNVILDIVHPYSSLALAASDAFSPGESHGGNFFVLWQLSKCHQEPDTMSTELAMDEFEFFPREREWVRRQRRKLKARLLHLFPANASQAQLVSLLKAARSDLMAIETLLTEIDED